MHTKRESLDRINPQFTLQKSKMLHGNRCCYRCYDSKSTYSRIFEVSAHDRTVNEVEIRNIVEVSALYSAHPLLIHPPSLIHTSQVLNEIQTVPDHHLSIYFDVTDQAAR